jgi:predicted transcriptional regulator
MDDVLKDDETSIELPPEMREAFDKIATALGRNRAWVVTRALRQYLDTEGADVLREAEGFAALDRGEGVDFDEVMDQLDEIITQAETRPREP